MGDDALVKVISELRVHYEQPIKAMQHMITKAENLNTALGKLNTTSSGLNKNFGTNAKKNMGAVTTAMQGHNREIQTANVLYDKTGGVLSDFTKKTKEHGEVAKKTSEQVSVLGSMWERRISWFVAGAAFYGGIRAMRSMIDIMTEIESSMIVIARTTTDLTFNMDEMRDSLIGLGKEFGHTWDIVQRVAIDWTRAGYDMQEVIEMTKNSLMALNVAEMDVQMASEGMIAIMAQWEMQASDMEEVIDKLNVTSDRFAITTGDLVQGLGRASGAARSVKLSFEETIGVLTAMRVATGRTGKEVGTAASTILSYIVRQDTLNKLMESGISVFADAAQTELRPALDILSEFARKWSDDVSEIPDQLLEIAEQAGLMTEEMASAVDMQEEWTDLQKIDLETSAAGIRRRNFLIALLRNFNMVMDVTTNLQDVQGYSMMQNVMTMDTMEKKVQSLSATFQHLAAQIGEAGMLDVLKTLMEMMTAILDVFVDAPPLVQSFASSLVLMTGSMFVLNSMLKMAGTSLAALIPKFATTTKMGFATSAAIGTASASMGTFAGATAAASAALTKLLAKLSVMLAPLATLHVIIPVVAAGLFALWNYTKRSNEEFERKAEVASELNKRMEQLDDQIRLNIEGSVAYNAAMNEKNELTKQAIDMYPELHGGYVEHTNHLGETTLMLELNRDRLQDLSDAQEDLIPIVDEHTQSVIEQRNAIRDLRREKGSLLERLQALQPETALRTETTGLLNQQTKELAESTSNLNNREKESFEIDRDMINIAKERMEQAEAEAEAQRDKIRRTENMLHKYELLSAALEKEKEGTEEYIRYKREQGEAIRIITELVGHEAAERILASDNFVNATNAEIGAMELKHGTLVDVSRKAIEIGQNMIRNTIKEAQLFIQAKNAEIKALRAKAEATRAAARADRSAGAEVGWHWFLMGEAGRQERQASAAIAEIDAAQRQISGLESDLRRLDTRLESYVPSTTKAGKATKALGDEMDKAAGSTSRGADSASRAADAAKTLADDIRGLIDYTKTHADTQRYANNEFERQIALTEARIDFYSRERASRQEQIDALKEEASLLPLLRANQRGILREIEALSGAKDILQGRQSRLNVRTKEGAEAYNTLRSEIDSIANSINQLQIEWLKLEQAQDIGMTGENRVRSIRDDTVRLTEKQIEYYRSIGDVASAEEARIELLARLERRLAQMGNEIDRARRLQSDAIQAYKRGEITWEQYNQVLADTNSTMTESKIVIMETKQAMQELSQTTEKASSDFENMMRDLDHYIRLGILTTDQLIDYTRRTFDLIRESMSIDQEYEEIQRLSRYYQEHFKEIRSEAKEAYDERIKIIRDAMEEEIAILQRRLDALDEEKELEDREEAERQHNKRMEDLYEDQKYHQLRTGIEHVRALSDIENQIEEEKLSWQQQLNEWARQDERDEINEQMQEIRDRAEEEIAIWENKLKEMEEEFSDFIINILAHGSAMDEDFYNIAKSSAERWVQGFRDGVPEDLSNIFTGVVTQPSMPMPSDPGDDDAGNEIWISPDQFDKVAGRTYMPARELAAMLGEPVSWDSANRKVIIGGKEFSPFVGEEKYAQSLSAGTAWLGIRRVAEELGHKVDWINNMVRIIPKAHTGAYVTAGGLANLLPGEVVFPPQLSSQIMTLIEAVSSRGSKNIDRSSANNYNAPLYNIEKQVIKEDVDATMIHRDIMRRVKQVISSS